MSSWRKSGRIASVAAGLIILVQFAVPISRLVDEDKATRFGWQMFSGSRAFPQLVVETPEGDVDIALSDFLIRQRVEIDVVQVLPPFLCSEIPNAVSVRWDDGEYQC